MQSYKGLQIWHLSHKLVLEVYSLTNHFPSNEKYGITNQLRRAIVSIPSNIAEGSSRSTDRDFKNYIHIALGSLAESSYLLLLSYELQLVDEDSYKKLEKELNYLQAMLINFLKRLRTS